jgi:hypothetical protein
MADRTQIRSPTRGGIDGMTHTTHTHTHDERRRTWRRAAVVGSLLVALALLAAACGGGDDVASGSRAARTVLIQDPTSGSQVGTSFTVTLAPSFAIGEPDTGRPHIHLHYDGSPQYDIVYATTHTVTGLAPGMHTIVAVVANPDHTETDVRSPEVTVQVGTGDAPAPPPATTPPAPRAGAGPAGY